MVGLEVDDIGVFDVESKEISISELYIDNIIPKTGYHLGLDISKNSTGITFIDNGERITGNIILEDIQGVHKEVLLRRALKRDLLELIEGKHFRVIIIEDAFVGENPETARLLFALNTAIDEIILDGKCSVDTFVRIPNTAWKSWLVSVIDTMGVTKGLNDKEKIRICMGMIGVFEEGKGYQDRLDSMGLLVSYFLKGKGEVESGKFSKKSKVRLSDIEASYEVDSSYLFYGRDDVNRDNIEFLDYRKITKNRVVELLTEYPDKVFVTEEPILLGNLGVDLGLDIIDGGGYLAFWVNPKKLKRYIVEEKK